MKKRIISLLLTALMVLSLFSGLSVSAHAATINGANTIEYTMGQGDYVLRICQKLGINYYTCKDAIMILNNIYDGQWNKLTVGRTLTLPASDYDALLISNGARTTTYSSGAAATTATTSNVTGTATTGTATTGTTASAAASSADTLAYYLVPYTMAYGDTVSGVCNSLGVNFSIFSPFIKQVNNISNWNKVRAGDTIVVPTPVCPSVGTTCYGVMQHKVASNDTAYGIVNSKGISYTANELLLKVLNQTDNLAAIKSGSWFFYPVPLTVSVPGTGNPGSTATTTTTTTVTDGNGTTTTQTTTTAKLYKLTSGMATVDGTMLFYVDSKPVTAAPAGAKVTIVTDTASGKALQSLTVKYSNGTADLRLTGDSFIMPGCDVRVDSVIKSGHDINISANYSGKAAASVNSVSVRSAVKGAAVVIRSTDPNYEVSTVYATYKKLVSSSTKTALTVSSSNAFIMPDADVDVEVVLKPVSTYAFYVKEPTPARGSFYLQVNGNAVTRAAKGATVTVVAKAVDGYEPVKIEVTKHDDSTKRVNVFSNTFTMPAYDVDVAVTFGAKGNNILIMPSQVGLVYAFAAAPTDPLDTDEIITDGDTNSDIYLAVFDPDTDDQITSGYNVKYDVVRNSDGLKVSVDMSGGNLVGKFKMPKGGVTVTPIITSEEMYNIWSEIYLNGVEIDANTYKDCSFSVTWNGKTSEFTMTDQELAKTKQIRSKIPAGEYIDLRYDSNEGVAFVKFRIMNGNTLFEEETNQANLHGYFQMPDKDIRIEAYFETGKVPMGPAAIEGIGSVSYKVTKDGGATWKSANTCDPGDTVLIILTNGNGYRFDPTKVDSKLKVTRKDNGAPIPLTEIGSALPLDPESYAYTFEMPAEGVNVQAVFDPKPFVITMKCVDETGKPLTGLGLWQIAIDWVPGVADNLTGINWFEFETKFDVAYGDYVTVAMTEAGWSKYDMVSFRINDQEYTADQLNYFYNFQMIEDRAKDLTITAVLRPKNVSIHSLSAMYDMTKGGVEFLILNSPSGYSDEYRRNNMGRLNYVNKAVAGDTVAIVANSVDAKYSVKASDITITPWGTDADRIVPTERWIDLFGNYVVAGTPDAVRVFTFTMPESEVTITLNFSGTQHILYVNVLQKVVDPLTNAESYESVSGMVRVFANNIYRDVAFNSSFDDIPYRTQVQILRSELAIAESKKIAAVDISTSTGKPVTYTDMSSAGEGIWFTMPDEPVFVVIKIDNMYYDVPTFVIDTEVTNGTLQFRKTANPADPTVPLSDFKIGDTVYVFARPDEGYKNLDAGDLKVYVNGMNNAASMTPLGTVLDGTPVWQFTLPGGTIIFKAEFQKANAEAAKITLSISNPPAEADVTINGYTKTYTDGESFFAFPGTTVTFTAPDGYEISSLASTSGKGVTSKTEYTVSDSLTDTDADSVKDDTLTITLVTTTNPINIESTSHGSVQSYDGSTTKLASSVKTGEQFYLSIVPDSGYELDELTVTSIYDDSIVTDTGGFYTMPEAGVNVKATFKATNHYLTIKVVPNTIMVNVSVNGGSAVMVSDGTAAPVAAGQTVKVTPVGGYKIVKIESTSGKGVTGTNTYVMPGDLTADDTLTVTLEESSLPIDKKTMTNGDLQFFNEDVYLSSLIERANYNETVYIKVIEFAGYELSELAVTSKKDGSIIPLTKNTDSSKKWHYSFAMPEQGVEVKATFVPTNNEITILVVDDADTPLTNSVTVTLETGGTVTVTNGLKVQSHTGQSIKVMPNDGVAWGTKGLTNVSANGEVTTNTGTTRVYKTATEDDTLTVHLAP